MVKRDKAALEGLLHKEYRGQDLLGFGGPTQADAAEAVAYWTSTVGRFAHFKIAIDRVQVLGDTAIETGTVSGTCGKPESAYIFQNISYTRVWVKDGTGWRLAYERY